MEEQMLVKSDVIGIHPTVNWENIEIKLKKIFGNDKKCFTCEGAANQNWLAELQDLLEEENINIKCFLLTCDSSITENNEHVHTDEAPIFVVINNRLRLRLAQKCLSAKTVHNIFRRLREKIDTEKRTAQVEQLLSEIKKIKQEAKNRYLQPDTDRENIRKLCNKIIRLTKEGDFNAIQKLLVTAMSNDFETIRDFEGRLPELKNRIEQFEETRKLAINMET